jgi:hypothetical protein
MIQPIIRAVRVIPQDVQRDINRLNDIRRQILELQTEHNRLGQKIADRLIPVVVGA